MIRKPSRRKLSTCSSVTSSKTVLLRDGRRHAGTVPARGRTQQAAARRVPRLGCGGDAGARWGQLGGGRGRARRRRWWRWPPGSPSSHATGSLRSDRAAEQARALRARALRLAQEELSSYAPVLEARDEHERELALAAASEPPAHIAEMAADVAELGRGGGRILVAVRARRRPDGRGARGGRGLGGVPAGGDQRGQRPGVRARPCGRTTSGEGASIRHGPATAAAARADPALTRRPATLAAFYMTCMQSAMSRGQRIRRPISVVS